MTVTFRLSLRRALLLAAATLVVVAAAMLWLTWPSSTTLTGYAARGDLASVWRGLKLGVDPNKASRYGVRGENEGQTPLTAAAESGRNDVISLLLEHGADPNLRDFGAEHPHDTPLSAAARAGLSDTCLALLKAGADPNIPTHPRQPGDPGNWTALDWALHGNHTAVADLLRAHGAVEGGRRRQLARLRPLRPPPERGQRVA